MRLKGECYYYELVDSKVYCTNFDGSLAYEIATCTEAQINELKQGKEITVETYGTFGVMPLTIKKA